MRDSGPSVAVIILAAGMSRRLGFPKQLCRWQGETLLARAVRIAREAQLGPVYVVLGGQEDRCRAALGESAEGLTILPNPDYARGLGTSIKAAAKALTESPQKFRAWIFCVCDQVHLNSSILKALVAKAEEKEPAGPAAAHYGEGWGTPFYVPFRFFSLVSTLADDKGIKSLVPGFGQEPLWVEFPGGEQDLDRPEQLIELGLLPPDPQA